MKLRALSFEIFLYRMMLITFILCAPAEAYQSIAAHYGFLTITRYTNLPLTHSLIRAYSCYVPAPILSELLTEAVSLTSTFSRTHFALAVCSR